MYHNRRGALGQVCLIVLILVSAFALTSARGIRSKATYGGPAYQDTTKRIGSSHHRSTGIPGLEPAVIEGETGMQ